MTTSPSTAWFPYTRPNPQARLRLFCLPFAGGAASIYRTWAQNLPDTVEVVPVQLPGREARMRETSYTRIGPMIESLATAIEGQLDRPYALFGHSMGTLISFELARALRGRGLRQPEQLFVSGHRAPQIPDHDEPIFDKPHDDFVAELRRLNGTPEAVLQHPELMELMLPLLRADFELCDTYAYERDAPFAFPITGFVGTRDPEADHAAMQAWGEQTSAAFRLHVVPGDHFFVLNNRDLLLRLLSNELTRLAQGLSGPAA